MTTATIGSGEWNTLARLVSRLHPSEVGDQPGVALRHIDNYRRWLISTPWIHFEGTGGRTDFADGHTTWLPGRLIVRAAELAETSGMCDITLGVQFASIASPAGSAHFNLPRVVPPLADVHRWPGAVSAAVRLDQFSDLLGVAGRRPVGVDLSVTTAPDVWLLIEKGTVGVCVAWSPFGAPQSTHRTPARTSGAAAVRIPHYDIAMLLAALNTHEDVVLELDLRQHVLWVDGTGWAAAVTLPPNTHHGHGVSLEGVLAALPANQDGASTWNVDIDGTPVTVERVDEATVRASVELIGGVGAELLDEINSLNRGLASVRIWLNHAQVFASIDLPRHHAAELPEAINHLVESTNDLGPLLGALAAMKDPS